VKLRLVVWQRSLHTEQVCWYREPDGSRIGSYSSLVGSWPVDFSSGRPGASHWHSYSGSADVCPCHFTQGVGPSASCGGRTNDVFFAVSR